MRPVASPREPRSPARRRRPVKLHHWPPCPVGSDAWWRQARRLGVDRDQAELTLRLAEHACPHGAADPHAVRARTPAEQAVVHFALLPRVPTYATMMYVTHAWHGGTRRLRKWILRQLATALDDGDAAQREAVLYALWVDFFEVTDTARLTFPYLWRTVRDHAAVLERSGPVPWAVKREALAEAARTPTLHEPLARAIAHGRDWDPTGAAIFCVEGHREELRRTIGASVLVWPPGIFDEDRPTSGPARSG